MNEALEKIRDLCRKNDEDSHRYEKDGNLSMAIMAGVRTQCYEECFEIVNNCANKDKYEELKHFIEMEIEQAEERMKEESNPTFNGLIVGNEFQIELNKGHIRFCKEVLKMLGK